MNYSYKYLLNGWLFFLPGQVSLIVVVSDKTKIEQSKEENDEMLMNPLYFKFVASDEIQLEQLKGEYWCTNDTFFFSLKASFGLNVFWTWFLKLDAENYMKFVKSSTPIMDSSYHYIRRKKDKTIEWPGQLSFLL